jgi:DNA-directed RNA polymerase specialized sigma24 family protein
VICCVVPRELESKLAGRLGRSLNEAGIDVVVERREIDRRAGDRRQGGHPGRDRLADRRRTRAAGGRRIADRRMPALAVPTPELPRAARRHAGRLAFVTPVQPTAGYLEDVAASRLVARLQAGDEDAAETLYLSWFDRAYAFARALHPDAAAAEAAVQDGYEAVFASLDGVDPSSLSFRVLLLGALLAGDVPAAEPREAPVGTPAGDALPALDWVSDTDLALLIAHLPPGEREALLLRYLGGLSIAQAAALLDLDADAAAELHDAALERLREILSAFGRSPGYSQREAMRRLIRPSTVLRSRREALLAH